MYIAGEYDVAVIGAGHAGCEAAVAAARLGVQTVLLTLSLDFVANMACNPNIGGSAKGHLVREIDALGGIMGKVADKTLIQSRMLNTGKGPAVWALRAQADRRAYSAEMKRVIETTENLDVKQAEAVEIITDDGRVSGVRLMTGSIILAKAVIIATGTNLGGRIIIGEHSHEGGPDGTFAARSLVESLKSLGVEMFRFKTGTPPRISRSSIDFSKMEEQRGDDVITPFSFDTTAEELKNFASCYLTYTSEKTHEIIRKNLHRAPMYRGDISGVGARYCPSIEDKIVRFPDKERHQIFIEPMGLDTEEMYVQGLSTSMPEDVQAEMLHSIAGLENAKIMRFAYAIEYDCANSLQLAPTLEFKSMPGLFGAGQFNGTSGYEEAAAQGLIAGINAARKVLGKDGLVLGRDEAYIGVLIDDLVTKGTNEPYRMMTSRAEYRTLLRQDNADERLTPKGYEIGLISEERYQRFLKKAEMVKEEIKRLESTVIPPGEKINSLLEARGSEKITSGVRLSDLLKRPQICYDDLKEIGKARLDLPKAVTEQAYLNLKYEGYIKRQKMMVEQFRKMENRLIPPDIDYMNIGGLRIEARQKLSKMQPKSIGQASRISGVNPSDISVLLVYLEQRRRSSAG